MVVTLIILGGLAVTTTTCAIVSSLTSTARINGEMERVRGSIAAISTVETNVSYLKSNLENAKLNLDSGKELYDGGGLIVDSSSCFVNSSLPDCQKKVNEAISALEKTAQALADQKAALYSNLTELRNQRDHVSQTQATQRDNNDRWQNIG